MPNPRAQKNPTFIPQALQGLADMGRGAVRGALAEGLGTAGDITQALSNIKTAGFMPAMLARGLQGPTSEEMSHALRGMTPNPLTQPDRAHTAQMGQTFGSVPASMAGGAGTNAALQKMAGRLSNMQKVESMMPKAPKPVAEVLKGPEPDFMRVYSGQRIPIEGKFDIMRADPHASMGRAFYTAELPRYANKFTGNQPGANVTPVDVDRNRMLMFDKMYDTPQGQMEGLDYYDMLRRQAMVKPGIGKDMIRQEILDAGFAGTQMPNATGKAYAIYDPSVAQDMSGRGFARGGLVDGSSNDDATGGQGWRAAPGMAAGGTPYKGINPMSTGLGRLLQQSADRKASSGLMAKNRQAQFANQATDRLNRQKQLAAAKTARLAALAPKLSTYVPPASGSTVPDPKVGSTAVPPANAAPSTSSVSTVSAKTTQPSGSATYYTDPATGEAYYLISGPDGSLYRSDRSMPGLPRVGIDYQPNTDASAPFRPKDPLAASIYDNMPPDQRVAYGKNWQETTGSTVGNIAPPKSDVLPEGYFRNPVKSSGSLSQIPGALNDGEFLPILKDADWYMTRDLENVPKDLSRTWRDPVSGYGISVDPYKDVSAAAFTYYDPQGRKLRSSIFNPDELYKNAQEFGINLSGIGSLGQKLDAAGVSYKPGELYAGTGSDHGINFADIAARNTGDQAVVPPKGAQGGLVHMATGGYKWISPMASGLGGISRQSVARDVASNKMAKERQAQFANQETDRLVRQNELAGAKALRLKNLMPSLSTSASPDSSIVKAKDSAAPLLPPPIDSALTGIAAEVQKKPSVVAKTDPAFGMKQDLLNLRSDLGLQPSQAIGSSIRSQIGFNPVTSKPITGNEPEIAPVVNAFQPSPVAARPTAAQLAAEYAKQDLQMKAYQTALRGQQTRLQSQDQAQRAANAPWTSTTVQDSDEFGTPFYRSQTTEEMTAAGKDPTGMGRFQQTSPISWGPTTSFYGGQLNVPIGARGGLVSMAGGGLAKKAADKAFRALPGQSFQGKTGLNMEMPKDIEKRILEITETGLILPSEALGKHEGKTLMITQADRTKVGEGFLGGPGFSGIQLTDPRYAGATWGVKTPGVGQTIIGSNRRVPEGQAIWTTMLGTPTQHKSNQMVFDRLYKEFMGGVKQEKLTPELKDTLNAKLASAVDKEGKNLFPADVDITNPRKFRKLVDTFDKRAAAADVMGGIGVGGKKGQIFDYDRIIRRTTDPALLEVPTGSLGNRLFQLSGEMMDRPDLHPAFPTILKGEDLGVSFMPAPRELLMEDYINKVLTEKGRQPGYMDWTRGYAPSQFLSEELLTKLQKAGYKKGGKVKKMQAGGIAKAVKSGLQALDKPAKQTITSAIDPSADLASRLTEQGRTSILPIPNRWFLQPEKFPQMQGLVERVLQVNNMRRSDFPSGAFVNPRTGEILDKRMMEDVGVVIDPKTNRPIMSAKREIETDLSDRKKGSITKSNLVRRQLYKPEGDPLLDELKFIATIEQSGAGHKYGLGTEYATPVEMFNTMTGENPTLRPKSRGDIFGIGDIVGRVTIGKGQPHDVYESLLVAPKGSDVEGVKLSKKKGGMVRRRK